MKSFLLFLVALLMLSLNVNAQYYENPDAVKTSKQNSKEQLYMRKVQQYQKLKKNGFIMIGAGVGAALIGVAVLNTVTYTYDPSTGFYEPDNIEADAAGTLLFLGGVSCGIGGTVLAILGSAKKKSYMRKLELLRVSYVPGRDYQGFSLAMKF